MHNTREIAVLQGVRREGKLIPFIGGGLSVPLGLPSWSDLIGIIAVKLGYDPEVFKLCGDHYQLAEYFVAMRGIGELRSEMDRQFNPPDQDIANSRSHNALIKMEFPIIYTTNYDRIIERAFELKGVPFYTISNIEDMAKVSSNATQIIKFHGTFSDDASLVLTESSYFDRLEFESAMDIKLRADMLGKCLMFIGYSLGDINIRYMLYKLHKLRDKVRREGERTPSAYLVTFGAGQVQRTILNQWDVSVIELDPIDRTKSMAHFLEEL